MPELAFGYLFKAMKTDINFFELDVSFRKKLVNWKGRLLMNNLISFIYGVHFKDYIQAI